MLEERAVRADPMAKWDMEINQQAEKIAMIHTGGKTLIRTRYFPTKIAVGLSRFFPRVSGKHIETHSVFVTPMKSTQIQSIRHRGFSLVELLVVIAIIAVLAALVTMIARSALEKSAGAKALLNLRQSGGMLLAAAQENNGKFQYSWEDGDGASSLLPYNIIRKELNLRWGGPGESGSPELCEIMHWNASKLKPRNYELNCFGVNFTDVIDPADAGQYLVEWKEEAFTSTEPPATFTTHTLLQTTVSRPEAYPILMDSSDGRGEETFRIDAAQSGFPGLRNDGRANAYFLDGSARSLDRIALKKVGFNRACDNQVKPPKVVTF